MGSIQLIDWIYKLAISSRIRNVLGWLSPDDVQLIVESFSLSEKKPCLTSLVLFQSHMIQGFHI